MARFTFHPDLPLRRAAVRFFPRPKTGAVIPGEDVLFETCSQHTPAGFMPLGAFSYTQSHFQPVDRIGRYCSIAVNVSVLGDTHPVEWATTSPVAYRPQRRNMWGVSNGAALAFDYQPAPVTIGNDVWIGQDVRLRGGIVIGDGAVVASGATVTRDVAPFTIVGGLPAAPLRDRFDPMVRDALIASRWWQYHWDDLADLPADQPAAFAEGVRARADRLQPLPEDRRSIHAHLARF